MWFYHNKQNLFFLLAFVSALFMANAFSVLAVSVDNIPSATSIMSEMEQRYHLNVGAIQNQGEALNVAGNKTPVPEVSFFFSPSDPKPGEKLSVKALPIYFSNTEESLYYTWYLKRKGCDLEKSVGGSNSCDVNQDGDITVEDWKIEAARILAQNGYDNTGVSYGSDSDDDGYRARFGGDNKVNTPDYCYVHDSDSGVNYELVDSGDTPRCEHLFPDATSETTGDGSFGKSEEKFWGTNPNDPDTAGNGNKDEANVVGFGQSTFIWNYAPGDQVGVAVEGTSMIPTKHDDSSYMIMWAFPKKDCPVSLADTTDSYTEKIGGYDVAISTAVSMDLNDCIEKNLVDPTQGGQATSLEVSVTAVPDNPINDETPDKGGDIVAALASVSNAQHNVTDMLFEWTVEISKDINFNDKRDITNVLRTAGLLGNTKGNALDSIRLKLDMPSSITSGYLTGDTGYLRFKSTVTENFSGAAIRKGKSDVIVKFTSTGKKISAYKAGTELALGVRKATLSSSGMICNDDALDRAACRVIKNEIIGLKVDNSSGDLSNFYWTVNGAPLACSKKVSNDCGDTEQGNENFFPVVGNPGDTYTVTVTANNVSTGNALTLSRTFGVVTPEVTIESLDKNIAWPRLLGQYKDIAGQATAACPNGLCNDYSTSMFEAFSGSTLGFRATFVPGFLANIAAKEWSLDGASVTESASGELSFVADKPAGEIYNIGLTAQVKQSDETRRALFDIWGISPFESPEINFSTVIQAQLQDPNQGLVLGPESGPRKYFAAIVSYIPASILFTFRIFLSAILILFAASFLYALLENRRAKSFASSYPGEDTEK